MITVRQSLSEFQLTYSENVDKVETDSVFGRGQTVYMRTWGCTHNTSDTEYMAGQLAEAGFKVSLKDAERLSADLWLLNSCTVKNPAEDHFKNAIQAAQSAEIPVVVAGCVPQGAPKDKFVKGLSTIGVQQIDRVVEVVEETLKGNTVKIMGPKVAYYSKPLLIKFRNLVESAPVVPI